MKLTFLPGILLIVATAFTNMAMAQQLPTSMKKYEKTMPESIRKAIIKMQANPRRSIPLGNVAMRPVQLNTPQRGSIGDRERVLAILLERKANPRSHPAQTLVNVQRNPYSAQARMAQLQQTQRHRASFKTEAQKKADREATAAAVLAQMKRKR